VAMEAEAVVPRPLAAEEASPPPLVAMEAEAVVPRPLAACARPAGCLAMPALYVGGTAKNNFNKKMDVASLDVVYSFVPYDPQKLPCAFVLMTRNDGSEICDPSPQLPLLEPDISAIVSSAIEIAELMACGSRVGVWCRGGRNRSAMLASMAVTLLAKLEPAYAKHNFKVLPPRDPVLRTLVEVARRAEDARSMKDDMWATAERLYHTPWGRV